METMEYVCPYQDLWTVKIAFSGLLSADIYFYIFFTFEIIILIR